ncbi:outer membrane protein [Parabacteroides sp. PF5-5]|uniref:TolC family protein n=1 Tax=unclassified Parabacteroides TaxID=2649774 RepID=UPI0024741635|nr:MULTISPECIES: TolC family protein [unclassified Parabacteroides]MDH6306512.1 outer membrane protein [Parabacteroides sp. PH5-39]MDH6317479.1 outer membrane protein [Parabacteroides sp. PF5-13]MDH6321218.1 outer membrane protein [Parabacteroides sp. PH5-13]MDH6324950.1 outer membrane protein [Parabacteroides sp. PH5-8]MDH6328659.1 outer membrane protein [Parabacteroides sp. PH5-41]
MKTKLSIYFIIALFLTYPMEKALAQRVNNDMYTPHKQQVARRTTERETRSTNTRNRNVKRWTLEECIQYAIDHNISIQRLKLQREVAGVQQNTAENSRLPDLNAGITQDWSFGRSQTYPDMDEPLSRTALGGSTSIPIFTGFRIPNEIARTKLEFEAATQNLEKAKDNLSINITSLFLQVLFNKELVKINEEQLALTQTQLRKTEYLIEAGSVPSVNLYDMEAQFAKDKVSVIEAQNNLELALLDLAQALELEQETQFDVRVPLFNEKLLGDMFRRIQPAQSIFEHAVSYKPVIKEQEFRIESAEKALKVAQADYMPNLSLVFEWGTGYLYKYNAKDVINPSTNQLIRANETFSNQLKNNDYMLIGLKLSIPIFNRYQTRNKVRTAKLDIQDRKLLLEDVKKTLYKEIQTAHKNAIAAHEKYMASNDAVKFTSESFEHAQIRYELAKLTPFEYNEVKTRFLQSQSEQIQAKYDYILRAKILDFYNGIPIKF